MKDTVLLEELSWPVVQEALSAGVRTVVIVVASVEQHGPHLPTMTDTAIGYTVGERVARKLGQSLLAPVIRPGCSDHHLTFPGSLSIPRETLIETVQAFVRSLAPHGFQNFVLFSSHGATSRRWTRLPSVSGTSSCRRTSGSRPKGAHAERYPWRRSGRDPGNRRRRVTRVRVLRRGSPLRMLDRHDTDLLKQADHILF